MTIQMLSDSCQNKRTFGLTREALLRDVPVGLTRFYEMKMLSLQASNSAADTLALEAYLRILAHNADLKLFAELHRAYIQEYPTYPHYPPEVLVERAQGFLEWNVEDRHIRFVHSSVRDYLLQYTDWTHGAS